VRELSVECQWKLQNQLDEEVKVKEEKDYHCQEDCKMKEMKDHEMSQVFQRMKDEQMKESLQKPMMWHNLCKSQMNDNSNHFEHFPKLSMKGEMHQEEEQQNSRHSQQLSFLHFQKVPAIDQNHLSGVL
jgi:hypothetical protein